MKFNKIIYSLMAICALTLFASNFTWIKSNNIYAATTTVTVDEVGVVNIYDNQQTFFEVTGHIVNPTTQTGADIDWFLNGIQIVDSQRITIPAEDNLSSVLRIYKIEYLNETSSSIWTVEARLSGNSLVKSSIDVFFKTTDNPLTITPDTATEQEFSETLLNAFSFTVAGNDLDPVEWYELIASNKYVPLDDINADERTYTFTPTKAGTYTFIAKVGDIFSDPFSVSVNYKTIEEIEISYTVIEDNANNFNSYQFQIDNLTEAYDVDNINWYIQGYTTPLQYGGLNFSFRPEAYGTYRILARYDESNISSATETIEVTINRTFELLVGSSIAIAIMGVILIINIVINVRREKIW